MSFWADSTVLVTGANGLTGSHLCRELLKAGARVKGLVKPAARLENLRGIQERVELIQGDITEPDSLTGAMRGVEYLFHPAAVVSLSDAMAFPEKAIQVNSVGAFHVAHAAVQAGVKRMLNIGTCHIYGEQPEYPIQETAVPRSAGIYAAAKFSGEILVRSLLSDQFQVVFSRSFAKFGPGQSEHFLIPNIIAQLLRGTDVQLGNPHPTRDYLYITDVVHGYMQILEKGRAGEIYHLSSGMERSVQEIFETISRICGVQARPLWNHTRRTLDTMRQVGDSSKVRDELGWRPRFTFEEGIRWTADWWRERLRRPVAASVVRS